MLETLRLQNYKRFKDLSFEGFQRVNLLTGKNNCGKTSVLESILLLLGWKESAQHFAKIFRPGKGQHLGDEDENFSKWLFPLRSLAQTPTISGVISDVGSYSVALQWNSGHAQPTSPSGMAYVHQGKLMISATSRVVGHGLKPVSTQNEVTCIPAEARDPAQEAKDYARVVLKSGAEDQVENMLRTIEPRLRSIRSLQPYGVPLLYAGIDGLPERIPVIQLGHGFSRLLTIMAEIVSSQKPVVLIDEVENGLHHSALPEIWRGLLLACEHSDVQVFATTHSWECVAAAHQAFSESLEYPLAVFRLEQKNSDIIAIAYDRASLEFSIERDWEVR